MTTDPIQWLLESGEPWTRYRTLIDLLDRPEDTPEVATARAEMLAHPQVHELIAEAATWPGYALKRHNDAKHPLYNWSTLADFGVRANDPGLNPAIEAVMANQSPMVKTITDQADGEERYTAGSMYRAWKGWSFADKKHPSPWLTFLALRVQRRMEIGLRVPPQRALR